MLTCPAALKDHYLWTSLFWQNDHLRTAVEDAKSSDI